jgi:hypothetical protein
MDTPISCETPGHQGVTLLAAVALLPSLLRRWRRVAGLAPHQLYTRLSHGAPLNLDVRSPKECTGALGHISGAVLLPFPELEGRLSARVPHRGRPIVTI